MIGPDIIAGEIDAIPTQRREPGQHSWIDGASSTTHFVDGAPQIATVEQDNRCGDEVERGRSGLLVLQATVAKTAEPMEGDRPGKAVAGLALVQLGSDGTAQSRILEPAEREQRALDPPDLPQRRSEAVLLAVGGQLLEDQRWRNGRSRIAPMTRSISGQWLTIRSRLSL